MSNKETYAIYVECNGPEKAHEDQFRCVGSDESEYEGPEPQKYTEDYCGPAYSQLYRKLCTGKCQPIPRVKKLSLEDICLE